MHFVDYFDVVVRHEVRWVSEQGNLILLVKYFATHDQLSFALLEKKYVSICLHFDKVALASCAHGLEQVPYVAIPSDKVHDVKFPLKGPIGFRFVHLVILDFSSLYSAQSCQWTKMLDARNLLANVQSLSRLEHSLGHAQLDALVFATQILDFVSVYFALPSE